VVVSLACHIEQIGHEMRFEPIEEAQRFDRVVTK